jgi:hypothetical protein
MFVQVCVIGSTAFTPSGQAPFTARVLVPCGHKWPLSRRRERRDTNMKEKAIVAFECGNGFFIPSISNLCAQIN